MVMPVIMAMIMTVVVIIKTKKLSQCAMTLMPVTVPMVVTVVCTTAIVIATVHENAAHVQLPRHKSYLNIDCRLDHQ